MTYLDMVYVLDLVCIGIATLLTLAVCVICYAELESID
jgi:hypothetical protein